MLNATTSSIDTAQVSLTGTFRAVDWVSRTARLYGDGGIMTTVRFTSDQDNWLRLVANVPVTIKGTPGQLSPDGSRGGQHVTDAEANGAAEYVQLTEVKVIQRGWFPYELDDFESVRAHYRYDPETHPTLSFDLDVDEFMRSIRGPDYEGSGI